MTLRIKLKHFWRIGKELFNDYADHSTIHGVSYMNEKNRSWFEKSWWIVVFVVSILGCGKMIIDAWNIKPIIISFSEKATSIDQVSDYSAKKSMKIITGIQISDTFPIRDCVSSNFFTNQAQRHL
jgi:Amiloride-sensitive sodium channel